MLKKHIDLIADYRIINRISNLTRVIAHEEEKPISGEETIAWSLKKAGVKGVGLILLQEMVQFDFTSKKGFEAVYEFDIKRF